MEDSPEVREGEWAPPADRVRWGKSEGLAMAEALRKSGLTSQEFAARHGIGVWRVLRWTRRGGSSEAKRARSVMKPAAGVRFAPVRIAERATAASLDVVVGRAVVRVVQDFDADLLRRVVRALGDGSC